MTTQGADTLVHEIGERGEFHLRLPAGEIELHGSEGGVVRVNDLDGHAVVDRFVVDAGPRSLDMRLRDGLGLRDFLRGRDNGRVRLRVDLPARSTVAIESASAGIAVEGLHGEQRYRSASGAIRVAGSGTYTIDNVSGSVRVDAEGDIELAVRVVSGDIAVHGGKLRSAVVSTTSGDVTLDSQLDGPGPYGIQSVSGDARVRAGSSLRVEARTLSGAIEGAFANALGGGRRKGGRNDLVFGDGAVVLSFKSISGDLRVTDSSPASGASFSHGAPEPPAPPVAPAPPDLPGGPAQAGRSPVAAAVREDERMTILKDLEEGRIDIAEATARLADLEGDDDA